MAATIPSVSRLSSRIIRVLCCNPGPMTLQGTNTYIIGTGERRILLDAGEQNDIQYMKRLEKVLKEENIDLEHIIVTHWHHDHIGGVHDVVSRLDNGCTVWKFKCIDPPDLPLPNNILLNYLKDGEEIRTEGATLRVIHTPGHTKDHIVLSLLEENCLFSGDCILGEGTAVFEDLYDYMNSLQRILELKPTCMYPGHGPVVEDPLPKIEYYINHRNKREEEIVRVLKEKGTKMSEMDIVKIIYTVSVFLIPIY
ncbi:Beta-lactamase-like protein 2 [Zootermopsis nevadensis]|uniref:Beta-lactamase-like protein 2 homolog n=1 Tax=Zootermopsis nevadensis TaxID=136037 RepID=A0A067R7A9_ZOONE|nr:Beta-lactamase-like protein 2 [Zootermopsis nevadensis]